MRTKQLSLVPTIILSVLVFNGLLYAGGQKEPINPANLDGKLVYVEGEVLINNRTAEIGDTVHTGDAVATSADGIAEITFGSRNILRFGENTRAVIDSEWKGVKMETGSMGAVLNGLARLGFDKDNRFQVKVPTASLGVRGTSFFISQPEENETYFCTCYGQLHIEPEDGSNAIDTEAYHHSAIWLVRTPDGMKALPSGLHYHDDSSMTEMAKKAGTAIRWRD